MKSLIGTDVPHDSAMTHVAGTSVFIDDMAALAGELVGEIVPAPVARGVLRALDLSAARAVPGVVAILTAADIKAGGGHNRFGPVVQDEDLVVEREIQFLGQPLALIAATTKEAALAARRAVRAEIEALAPVLTIEKAMEAGAYFGAPRHMGRGDLAAGFAAAERVVEGTLDIGGQEHFYLETQAALAIPGEQRTMLVHSSTQHPSEVQALVAEVLGVPFNHVICQCRRMGGGFGGKETQAAQPAMIAALLAARTNRSVRFVYNRDDDMAFTGKRHPFMAVYRAGFKASGEITALELALYSNGGCSTDLSFAVLERAMLHSDNAYFLPAVKIVGRVCQTNLPSNTAFRGFGGPQGVAAIEQVMTDGATALGMDSLAVRRVNLYGPAPERSVTHYGQTVGNNVLGRLVEELAVSAEYEKRRGEVAAFNAGSRTKVKGLALSLVKFGISFTRRTLNQANALVNIYVDGSVAVSTGATEMGQGVHTRVRMLVADDLGLEMSRVLVGVTSTEKNNNTSPTAASTGTDLNGAAALDATGRLKARLAEVAAGMLASAADGLTAEPAAMVFADGCVVDRRMPERRVTFEAVVRRAYELRVSLGERGFYATPGVDFNRETGKGTPFLYYTNGAACSEVLIDRSTGEMKVLRVDLLMDVGESINPGIDRGQVIGGFVQGMGWSTMEELVYGADGRLLTHSPDTYKIPAITDVPEVFNVAFLNNPDNVVSIKRSKAVGEPPLLLGLSVWLAVKDAVGFVSKEGAVGMRLPATGETILGRSRVGGKTGYNPSMALPAEKHRPTVQEYLELEAKAKDRHEYHNGEILMMAGGTYWHSRVASNFGRRLGNRLDGHPCEVSESNTRVSVQYRSTYLYPDLTVVCGDPVFDPEDANQTTITNPTLVIEVLSPGTEGYDRGAKFDLYRDLPTLKEYVLVSVNEPRVETFLRQADGNWLMSCVKGLEAVVKLGSIGVELPLAEIYDRISFGEAPKVG